MIRKGEEQYSVAKGYVQSMYLMMTNPHRLQLPDDRTYYLAFSMLAGFAIELYLKAYLAFHDYTDAQLRHADLRHDLIKLYERCIAEGLQSDEAKWLVEAYGPHHKTFEFRYMRDTTIYQAVSLEITFAALSWLDTKVDGAIGASASRGIARMDSWNFPKDGAWRLPPHAN